MNPGMTTMNTAARYSRTASAVVIVLCLAAPIAADDRDRSQIRIDNFAKVDANYFRGAQPMGEDYARLAALGVKTVINLIGDGDLQEDERAAVERHGMKYVQIPMSTRRAPTEKEIETFLSIATSGEPVFVHCVGGKHRTGVMTAVYRMTTSGWTSEQAYDEMKKHKYGPSFLHPEFKSFVYNFKPSRPAAAVATQQQ
jgi:uncharacterized protein (TIGR01244 family)